MKEFEFELIFKVDNTSADQRDYADVLFEAGCDDALVSIGKRGIISLDFTRVAESANDALFSAVRNVKEAIPSAMLIEATPDFVGITDIADILGFTRQNARNVITNEDGPIPIHLGSSSLWHLSEVFGWLEKKNNLERYGVTPTNIEIARVTKTINRNLEEVRAQSYESLLQA